MNILPTNDVVFKKLFASQQNMSILQSFVQDILGFDLHISQIKNPYHIEDFVKPDSDTLLYTEVDLLA